MKRTHLILLCVFVVLTIAAGVASTESINPPTALAAPTPPVVVEGARTVITSDVGVAPVLPSMLEPLTTGGLLDALRVTGKPYAATFESETVENNPGGAPSVRRMVTRVWRDSQGRVRREQIFYPTGATPQPTDPAQSVVITDPVARWGYALNQANRTAQKHRLPAAPSILSLFDNQVPLLVNILRQENPASGNAPQNFTLAAPVVTALGRQTINGVQADGRRLTMLLPAGAVGNQTPVNATYELWIAPDLQLLVKGSAGNPTSGTHTFQLKTISRAEPASSLFAVPSNYAVTEMGVVRTDLPPPIPSPQPTATQTPVQ